MFVTAINWVLFHVMKRVVHPSHVPLQRKTQAALFWRRCNSGPCGRLFGDHEHSGASFSDDAVEVLEKLDGFEVLAAAVLVRDPFSWFPTIVAVEHRRDSV